ncbi:hypothetical protein JCM18382A_60480 [Bradyrhizobium sp. 17-4]
MDVAERQAFFLGGRHPFGNPTLEFLDRVATDGELDEMQRHTADVAAGARFGKGAIKAAVDIGIIAGSMQ